MTFSYVDDNRCEIIDGAQRIQALEEFISGDLVLGDLKKLHFLNRFSYEDLPTYIRRKLDKTNMRVIVFPMKPLSRIDRNYSVA